MPRVAVSSSDMSSCFRSIGSGTGPSLRQKLLWMSATVEAEPEPAVIRRAGASVGRLWPRAIRARAAALTNPLVGAWLALRARAGFDELFFNGRSFHDDWLMRRAIESS